MNNNLIEMQEMLFNQMKRLDVLDYKIGGDKTEEISRANALSNTAVTFLKSVNVGLRVIETSKKYDVTKDKLGKDLGIYNEK